MKTELKMENITDKFVSSVDVQIRFEDLDTLGHVTNKAYLSYLDEARIEYLRQLVGLRKDLTFDAVVGRIDIVYKKPLFYKDKIKVYTRIAEIGVKSYVFENYIVKYNDGKAELSASASVSMVSFDLKSGKSKNNSDEMIRKVLEFEKIRPVLVRNTTKFRDIQNN